MAQTLTRPVPEGPLYRLSPAQYDAMVKAGIVDEQDRVELLEGVLVEKMTQNPPHMVACTLLLSALRTVVPSGWFLTMGSPLATDDSLPEPDAALVRGEPRHYLSRRWGAPDIGLAVEVSDTTLETDQGTKKRLYARAGVPLYWIVNLVARRVEVHTGPSGPADEPDYQARQEFIPGDVVPLTLDGASVGTVAVSDLLP